MYQSKDTAKVKFFRTNKRTEGHAKNYMPLIYRFGGIRQILGNEEKFTLTKKCRL